MNYVYAHDYFNNGDETNGVGHSYVRDTRKAINSYTVVGLQYQWIDLHRKSVKNRNLDYEYFGIPRDAVIPPGKDLDRSTNKYYEYADRSKLEDYDEIYDINDSQTDDKKDKNVKKKALKIFRTYKIVSKIIIVAFIIIFISIASLAIYGIVNSKFGDTPFTICKNGAGGSISGTSSGTFSLELPMTDGKGNPIKDENGNQKVMKIPGNAWDYKGWEENHSYNTKDFIGDENNRGKGIFCKEDAYTDKDGIKKFGKTLGNELENSIYYCNMRWEYVETVYTDGHSYGIGNDDLDQMKQMFERTNVSDEVKNKINTTAHKPSASKTKNADNQGYSFTYRQKVLLYSPEKEKGVVCYVGFAGTDPDRNGDFAGGEAKNYCKGNCNWGPGVSQRIGGCSRAALDALGFSGTKAYLEAYFVNDPEIKVGPCAVDGNELSSMSSSSAMGNCGNIVRNIGTGTLCDAAVSLCWDEQKGTKMTPEYESACKKYGIHEPIACASLVSAAILTATDDKEILDGFNPCSAMDVAKALDKSDRFANITTEVKSNKDLLPGDVIFRSENFPYTHETVTGGASHILMYVGKDAVQKRYPGCEYEWAQASYTSQSAHLCNGGYSGDVTRMPNVAIFRQVK